MEAPKQVKPQTLDDYLEVMSKVAFQSGMSWAIVENKWEGTRDAFQGFDPIKVASLTTKQIDARGSVMAWNDGEVEVIAVHNTGGDRHLNDVVQEKRAGAVATRARVGP